MQDDQDSLVVEVEMPKEERKKHTAAITDWEFSSFSQEYNHLKLFLCANQVYIRNLIKGKEEPRARTISKAKEPGLLLEQPFATTLRTPSGHQDCIIDVKGVIELTYSNYRGMRLQVTFDNTPITPQDYFVARFMILDNPDKRFKTLKLQKDEERTYFCFIEDTNLDQILNKFLAFEIQLQRDIIQQQQYVGLRNEGNTCYMNSILQILFFMRPLRKMVVQYRGQGKVMLALKEVFLRLMDGPNSRTGSVDAEELIEAYGRFADYPRRQQDTQEFLLGFLQELEGECPSLAQLWQGQSLQTLESKEQEKPYRSVQKEDFNGLDLPLEDIKGNTFGQILPSLQHLLDTEHVEDKIESDDFGKVSVTKSRSFSNIPPVLFLTLKRYQFKKNQSRPTKIMADLKYPSRINLSFLEGTPRCDMEYELFAVTIHKGQSYNSGHYYSFINTSDDLDEPYWVRFDDSRVHAASKDQVLGYTGGKKKLKCWNSQFVRFMEKEILAQDTAYVLVYYKREVFRQYQNLNVPIPKEWFQQKRKVRASQVIREEQGSFNVQVVVAEFTGQVGLFGAIETIPLALKPYEDTVTQLKNFNGSFLGCKVGSVWKVNKGDKKVKKLVQFADLPQTPHRIFQQKRGHRIPDYLLIIPQKTPVYSSSALASGSQQGLVKISMMTEEGLVSTLSVIQKDSFDDFINDQEKRLGHKATLQIRDKEDFQTNWNDLIQIIFE